MFTALLILILPSSTFGSHPSPNNSASCFDVIAPSFRLFFLSALISLALSWNATPRSGFNVPSFMWMYGLKFSVNYTDIVRRASCKSSGLLIARVLLEIKACMAQWILNRCSLVCFLGLLVPPSQSFSFSFFGALSVTLSQASRHRSGNPFVNTLTTN